MTTVFVLGMPAAVDAAQPIDVWTDLLVEAQLDNAAEYAQSWDNYVEQQAALAEIRCDRHEDKNRANGVPEQTVPHAKSQAEDVAVAVATCEAPLYLVTGMTTNFTMRFEVAIQYLKPTPTLAQPTKKTWTDVREDFSISGAASRSSCSFVSVHGEAACEVVIDWAIPFNHPTLAYPHRAAHRIWINGNRPDPVFDQWPSPNVWMAQCAADPDEAGGHVRTCGNYDNP